MQALTQKMRKAKKKTNKTISLIKVKEDRFQGTRIYRKLKMVKDLKRQVDIKNKGIRQIFIKKSLKQCLSVVN
jgi:hypothetical protein